jgi:prolyl-tRNA editing enzyme YbaK/EbsC (Cys-tRNA(Pro) deacylase)
MRSVDRVRQALAAHGLDMEVRELPQSTRTAPQAAAAIGCELGAIVKSLLFLADGRPALVLVAGDRRADPVLLRTVLGASQVAMANADRVRAETGFTIGGVPPVGHTQPLRVYIDRSLARFEIVWAAAGGPNAVFPIRYATLVEITGGQVADVIAEEAVP